MTARPVMSRAARGRLRWVVGMAVVGGAAALGLLTRWSGRALEPTSIAVFYGAYADSQLVEALHAKLRRDVAQLARQSDRDIGLVFVPIANVEAPHVVVAAAESLIATGGILGVVTDLPSRAVLASEGVFRRAGIPQIAPSATSMQIHRGNRWVLPMAPADSVQGAFIATFVTNALQSRRVAMFTTADEYGESIRQGVRNALQSVGVSVVAEVLVDERSNFADLVRGVMRERRPDAILVCGLHPVVGPVARAAHAIDPRIALVASDGAFSNVAELTRLAGPSLDSLYVVSFWAPTSDHGPSWEFTEALREAGAEPQWGAAVQYDAVMALVSAVVAVGSDPRAVRGFLLGHDGRRAPYHGLTGEVSFGEDGGVGLLMVRIRNGRLVPVLDWTP